MRHLIPSPKGPTPDHAFIDESLDGSWLLTDYCEGMSDHKFMILRVEKVIKN
ncbi:hypothetical protein AYI68_g7270, partial [Smittium mucronatum]